MTKTLIKTVMITLSLTLSACTTFDIGPSPTASLSAETSALNAPASWVFGDQADGQIASAWSSVLSDPMLDNYIETALQNNPSLRASAESVARSEALLRQARSNLLPSVGYSTSANGGGALEGDNFSDSYSAGLNASWEADLWGDIKAGVLASTYDLEGTKAAYETARQALIASVARAYILTIESEYLIALSEQTLVALEETLRIVKVRYDLGAASRRELVLAESDVANARDGLIVARDAETDAAMALQILLGRYPDGEVDISPDFPVIAQSLSSGTPADILRRRPDIIASEMGVLRAFQDTRIARTGKWPNLTISGGLTTGAGNIGDILDPVSIAYSLGARLAGSLFDGGLTEARIDAATVAQRQAVANYGQSVLDAYFDVETALKDIRTLETRAPFVAQSAEAARETLALAEIQYKEGAIDLLDVLTFRQRSFQADQTEITLQRQILEARIALYLALGGAGF